MTLSFLGAAGGLLLTSSIHAGSTYLGGILPGVTVLALFCRLSFAPTMNAALHQVTGQDSSLASGTRSPKLTPRRRACRNPPSPLSRALQ